MGYTSNGYDKYKFDGYTVYGRISSPETDHAVEDARTKPAPKEEKRTPKRAETKEKRRTRKGSKTLFIVCVTVLCFALSIFLADILSGTATLSDYVALFKHEQENARLYYAVYATHAADMGISYRNASVLHAEGGAGYVWKRENEYYVVASAYASKEDAEKVANKQSNYGVFEIKIYNVEEKKKNSEFLGAERGNEMIAEAFDALYTTANDVAAGTYDTSEMKKRLSLTQGKIAAHEEAYQAERAGKEDGFAIEYKVQLKTMKSAFDNLMAHDGDLVAEARYYAVMILHSYSLFTEKYFK